MDSYQDSYFSRQCGSSVPRRRHLGVTAGLAADAVRSVAAFIYVCIAAMSTRPLMGHAPRLPRAATGCSNDMYAVISFARVYAASYQGSSRAAAASITPRT